MRARHEQSASGQSTSHRTVRELSPIPGQTHVLSIKLLLVRVPCCWFFVLPSGSATDCTDMHTLAIAFVCRRAFKRKQRGKIGLALNGDWYEAKPAADLGEQRRNEKAAERALEFSIGWFARPVYQVGPAHCPVLPFIVWLAAWQHCPVWSVCGLLSTGQLRL